MNITLLPEHEELISRALESGAYQSPDRMMERALELLRQEDEHLLLHKSAIEAKIERALAQFDCGESLSPEHSRQDMALRKAARAQIRFAS